MSKYSTFLLLVLVGALALTLTACGGQATPAPAAQATKAPAPTEAQSEAVTFSADGSAWYSSGEQQPVIFESLAACQ